MTWSTVYQMYQQMMCILNCSLVIPGNLLSKPVLLFTCQTYAGIMKLFDPNHGSAFERFGIMWSHI